jgi:hypothetical protein
MKGRAPAPPSPQTPILNTPLTWWSTYLFCYYSDPVIYSYDTAISGNLCSKSVSIDHYIVYVFTDRMQVFELYFLPFWTLCSI